MTKPLPPRAKGISGLVLLFCVTALAAGVGFDFLTERRVWWLGAEHGAGAVIGVAAAVFTVLAGHLLRLVLKRQEPKSETGESDAGHHA